MEVVAEVLVSAGVSEDCAGEVASHLLTALRDAGHSEYLAPAEVA
jgi:hypothetical protein